MVERHKILDVKSRHNGSKNSALSPQNGNKWKERAQAAEAAGSRKGDQGGADKGKRRWDASGKELPGQGEGGVKGSFQGTVPVSQPNLQALSCRQTPLPALVTPDVPKSAQLWS